jgi:hypothetical protein
LFLITDGAGGGVFVGPVFFAMLRQRHETRVLEDWGTVVWTNSRDAGKFIA